MHKVSVTHQEIDEELFIRSEKLKINNKMEVYGNLFSNSKKGFN